jgi:hypothetical protein
LYAGAVGQFTHLSFLLFGGEALTMEAWVTPLIAWHKEHRIAMPWRENQDAYRVWISEIMLQQTRIEAVIPYYERFMRELPDVAALAQVEEDRLLKLWEGLGYYSRARNLKKAAITVMEKHGGVLPADAAALRALFERFEKGDFSGADQQNEAVRLAFEERFAELETTEPPAKVPATEAQNRCFADLMKRIGEAKDKVDIGKIRDMIIDADQREKISVRQVETLSKMLDERAQKMFF